MKHALLGNLEKGILFIISAPAGTGKTTLVRMLTDEFSAVAENISYTTRDTRTGEIPGKDYHFVTEETFLSKVKQGEFLEYAKVFNHYYGTLSTDVEVQLNKGKHVVLVIDTQGALQLKKRINSGYIEHEVKIGNFAKPVVPDLRQSKLSLSEGNRGDVDCLKYEDSEAGKNPIFASRSIYIFISPPSLMVLRERLISRKRESGERIEERLAWAEKEIEEIKNYDYHIVNENLEMAYEILRSIFIAEERRIRR